VPFNRPVINPRGPEKRVCTSLCHVSFSPSFPTSSSYRDSAYVPLITRFQHRRDIPNASTQTASRQTKIGPLPSSSSSKALQHNSFPRSSRNPQARLFIINQHSRQPHDAEELFFIRGHHNIPGKKFETEYGVNGTRLNS
jgi:hypothetical protein